MNRSEKEQVIQELKEDFEKSKAVIFADYRGLTVAELSELRRLLKEGNIDFKVVKNTLARIAAEGTPVSAARDYFKGPVGVAVSYTDPVAIVKKVLEFSKKNDKLKIGIGLIEGSVCPSKELKAVAEIPPRPVLLSMMAGVFQAPLSKMAGALNATLSKFGNALEALKNKKVDS
ncbi:MAG: 50S ribosomal protein L10 [Nitrospirota bacterium]